jgi:hypothetical protein
MGANEAPEVADLGAGVVKDIATRARENLATPYRVDTAFAEAPSPITVSVGDINVNDIPPGVSAKEVSEHVANQVGRVIAQKTREAANTVQRAGVQR